MEGREARKRANISYKFLEEALPNAPLELFLPASRGWLARFADVFPRSLLALRPLLRWRGLRNQRRLMETR